MQNGTIWRALLGVEKTVIEGIEFDQDEQLLVAHVRPPDVWNGYFLGPPSRVLATYTQQQPRWLEVRGQLIEIPVIGSDGGGALYVVPLDDSGSVYRIEDAAITDGVLRAGREQQTRKVGGFPGVPLPFCRGSGRLSWRAAQYLPSSRRGALESAERHRSHLGMSVKT